MRTSRDREFERSGVNLLCYIEKKKWDQSFTSRDRSSSQRESPVELSTKFVCKVASKKKTGKKVLIGEFI